MGGDRVRMRARMRGAWAATSSHSSPAKWESGLVAVFTPLRQHPSTIFTPLGQRARNRAEPAAVRDLPLPFALYYCAIVDCTISFAPLPARRLPRPFRAAAAWLPPSEVVCANLYCLPAQLQCSSSTVACALVWGGVTSRASSRVSYTNIWRGRSPLLTLL